MGVGVRPRASLDPRAGTIRYSEPSVYRKDVGHHKRFVKAKFICIIQVIVVCELVTERRKLYSPLIYPPTSHILRPTLLQQACGMGAPLNC